MLGLPNSLQTDHLPHDPHLPRTVTQVFSLFFSYFIVLVDRHSDTSCTFTRLKLVH
jgi:hypothetical protein